MLENLDKTSLIKSYISYSATFLEHMDIIRVSTLF